mmetsp:Transcript_65006/g.121072  ORF Transcript_65006/g.121072 Transcript_65006/m.121072 type:complete len:358 (+) Transcript_65006:78-1151(+)
MALEEEAALGSARPADFAIPPARRLQRLRREVEALCTWTEMRSNLAASTDKAAASGERADGTVEAECLAAEAKAVLQLASQAVAAGASSGAGNAMPKGAVWLGPTANYTDDTAMVRNLLSMHQTSAPSRSSSSREAPAYSYKLTTELGAEGWAQVRDAEGVAGLERRVQFLQQQLTTGEEAGSLSSSVGTLERRLGVLQQACSEEACNKLLSSIQCIASDLEEAMYEIQRFIKLDAEERAMAAEGEVGATVEDVSTQIAKLHSEALQQSRTPLRAVSARVTEVDNMLTAGEVTHKQLQHFSEDLTAVEARFAWTKTLLEETVAATTQMKESAKENRERMTRNLASLEAKLLAIQSKR